MEVRRWMKHPVHTVKPLDSIQHARELVERYRINQLPVVVDGRLTGIVTDRDLRDAFPSVFESPPFAPPKRAPRATDPRKVTVNEVMSPNVTTIGPGDSITAAARLLRTQRIGALPVIENERIVGIVTRSDILDGFIELLALEEVRESGSLPIDPAGPSGPGTRAGRTPRRVG